MNVGEIKKLCSEHMDFIAFHKICLDNEATITITAPGKKTKSLSSKETRWIASAIRQEINKVVLDIESRIMAGTIKKV